jgi:hypothetical protein
MTRDQWQCLIFDLAQQATRDREPLIERACFELSAALEADREQRATVTRLFRNMERMVES